MTATPAADPAATPDPPAAPPAAAPEPPAATPTPAAAPSGLPDDPAALRAEIDKLRKENGAARTTAKAQAAEEARAELAQSIGKAIGLVPDEAADPAKLTEQLTAQTAAAKQAQIELAVYRAADAAKGDPAALLDSRTFLEKVAAIDPSDSAAITAAITEAVTANPRLGTTPPPGASPTGMGRNPAQGASASPPLGLEAQIQAAEAAGDHKTAIRLKTSKALTPQT